MKVLLGKESYFSKRCYAFSSPCRWLEEKSDILIRKRHPMLVRLLLKLEYNVKTFKQL